MSGDGEKKRATSTRGGENRRVGGEKGLRQTEWEIEWEEGNTGDGWWCAARVSVMRFQTNGETVSGNVTKGAVHGEDAIGKFTLRPTVSYQSGSRNGTRDGSCPR